MKRFYCPKCDKVRRTRKDVKDKSLHQHRTVAGAPIRVPVADCFRHKGGAK